MFKRLINFFSLYTSLVRDPRTPARAKYLPWVALIYLIFPIDIIPDIIPLLGQADDITAIIVLLWMAINSISDKEYEDHARKKKFKDAIDVTPKD
jgi:uncharacterized membrane protein YkvA (DUF1232 family)